MSDAEAHFLNYYAYLLGKRCGQDCWIGVKFETSFQRWVEVSNTVFLEIEKLSVQFSNPG